jgi:hypothetical protein
MHTAADPAPSTIAHPATAIAGAALAIGSAFANMRHPSPTAAPVIINTPPSSCGSPPMQAPNTADLALDAPPATGPPTPPPWPEADVFSADPDRIVCRKCCKRHYNYRWYSHCFMCNQKYLFIYLLNDCNEWMI